MKYSSGREFVAKVIEKCGDKVTTNSVAKALLEIYGPPVHVVNIKGEELIEEELNDIKDVFDCAGLARLINKIKKEA